ncbi:MAG: type II toxin-antitoxin system PemK/MazF family toxin [Pseudomonadota bacterium]|nr:type II toxin-antitoxin system PemK/MazF family toxin [Pseudomonadota bacterium]MDE3037297.1 type II toxin-antitoxin system PemK/MazF family toxin [Pseudomonadota bacterium]
MIKDFTKWHKIKTLLEGKQKLPIYQTREIWWCSLGANIGHEQDGKSGFYLRPVLVIRKFNPHIFFGVPLTTRIKENPYYHRIHFRGKEQCVMLSQLRLWDSKRLSQKMGKLPEDQFEEIRNALKGLM